MKICSKLVEGLEITLYIIGPSTVIDGILLCRSFFYWFEKVNYVGLSCCTFALSNVVYFLYLHCFSFIRIEQLSEEVHSHLSTLLTYKKRCVNHDSTQQTFAVQ